jgi:tetratricopeptide (TPR) repeat protein
VIDFLPPAFRGHLLLTTRAQTMGKIIGNKLEMEVMRPEVGALLLLRRARIVTAEASLEKAPEEVVAQAIKLAKDLGGLPLALDQAGAYIEETQCGILDYQRQYQIRRAELLARRGGLKDDHPEPVFTTWSLSFAKVEATNPMSAKLLQICAFLAPDAIPEKLLVEALKNPQHASRKTEQENEEGVWFSSIASGQLDEAMAVLLAYSLVQRNPQEKTLSVHRLVQAVLRDSMEVKIAKYWKQQMVLVVSKAFPSLKDVRQWDICEQWLPHALMCITWIEQEQMITEEAEHLLSAIGLYLDVRARYREAESLLEYAHSIQEQRFGSEHPYTADSLNNLAFLYHHQGRYTEAEPLYLRALKIYEQRLGPEHPATILCLNNLAMLYQDQGKYIEAQRLLKQVVMITEQLLGREHPVMARGLNNLAMVYYHQGRYTKAEPLYLRALKIYEHRLGPEHPDTSLCLNNLATLYRAQRKYAEAELLLERALSIQEQQLGPEHPDTANALNNLAIVYQDQRKYAEAELLLERALSIREQQLGPEHPETATTLNNLALLYAEQGKYTQAEPLYQRALATLERQLGPEHPNTQGALKNYTTLLHNLKRTKRSRNKWLRRF